MVWVRSPAWELPHAAGTAQKKKKKKKKKNPGWKRRGSGAETLVHGLIVLFEFIEL